MSTFAYAGSNPIILFDPFGLEITGQWLRRDQPAIRGLTVLWGDARRPDGWWRFWENGMTYRAMEHAVKLRIGWEWHIRCIDTTECDSESWDIEAATNMDVKVYVPIFTPIHPRLGRYTSVLNPAYNLLIDPVVTGALEQAASHANAFYENTTATQLCRMRTSRSR